MDDSLTISGARSFRLLLAIHTLSSIGANITIIALPWFVLQLTGSATLTGLSGGALAAAAFSAGFFGGVLVDRFGYKRTGVLADGVSAAAILALPLFFATTGITFLGALALIFFARLLDIPVLTARRSMVPEMAAQAGMPLERANSLFEGCMHVASLVGPISAGLLIAFLGPANVFTVAAALVGAAAVGNWLLLPVERQLERETDPQRATGFRADFVEGLRFVVSDRLLLGLLVAMGIINFITFPLPGVILPVYADTVLGSAAQLGILLSIWGVGVLLGTVIYGIVGHRIARRPLWVAAHALFAVPIVGLIFELSLVALTPLVILAALAFGPLNPITVTVRHERVPIALRGRVFAVYGSVALGFAPLGNMIAGAAIDTVGISLTLTIIAVLVVIYAAVLAAMPVFKQLERPVSDTA